MKDMMKSIMTKAHEMAKNIKAKYPEIDYRAQLGINISYLWKRVKELNITRTNVRKPDVCMGITTAPEYGFKENKNSFVIALGGDTYPVREDIKKLGFSWCPFTKEWIIIQENHINVELCKKIVKAMGIRRSRYHASKLLTHADYE